MWRKGFMRNLETWKLISQSLQQGIQVMLMYVVHSAGSSPGRQGFFMAVNAKNRIEGSIGGGIMEHKFVEMAKEMLRSGEAQIPMLRKQLHDKEAARNQSGMICSGEQTIFICRLKDSDEKTIRDIVLALESNQHATLILDSTGIAFSPEVPDSTFQFLQPGEENWLYKEKIGFRDELYIIGGGHCGLALSDLMSRMDFFVRVFDDRQNLETLNRNYFAHEKIVVEDYGQLKEMISPGANRYVVIMTQGYRTDDQAIRALVGKSFAYIGVLGSKTKIRKMMNEYAASGLDQDWLDQLHAPLGVEINSQTPEEIAVSIAAEIIRIRNANLK